MAKLNLTARYFASVMREVYGYHSIKINRMLTRALKKDLHLTAALSDNDTHSLIAYITALMPEGEPSPICDKNATTFSPSRVKLTFTKVEWTELVASLGGTTSAKTVGVFADVPLDFDLERWEAKLRPLIKEILSRGTRGGARNAS